MLPPTIPIFPLPNVVLFPNVFLPLHIFEARYRQMVDEALKGDRIIGMVLLRPGWEGDYEGRPPVYPIGCAGVITHAERLPDGRFNIVLRGMEKFQIRGEQEGQLYRLGPLGAGPGTAPRGVGAGPGRRDVPRADAQRAAAARGAARAAAGGTARSQGALGNGRRG